MFFFSLPLRFLSNLHLLRSTFSKSILDDNKNRHSYEASLSSYQKEILNQKPQDKSFIVLNKTSDLSYLSFYCQYHSDDNIDLYMKSKFLFIFRS